MMRKIRLKLSHGRSYAIWIGSGKWPRDPVLDQAGHGVLIADSRLKAHTARVERELRSRGWRTTLIRVPATEASKNFQSLDSIYRQLIQSGADRKSVVFAVGGGVIGDIAGFVAATYMRGIRWVGVPTTLLAQVDSAIGGKTGVNHSLGKNLIGAFHQPSLVICDLSMLKTLPKREMVSGLGEIVKYALLSDRHFYYWVTRNWQSLLNLAPPAMEKAVYQCVSIKAKIVSADEHENRGVRAQLNLGHTVGHALEAATRYTRFRHGEAVLHGLRAMLELSVARGHMSLEKKYEIDEFLAAISIPKVPSIVSVQKISGYTARDKKSENGVRRFILLKDIGKPVIDSKVVEKDLTQSLRSLGMV